MPSRTILMCSGADSPLGSVSQMLFGSGPAIPAGNLSFYQSLKITYWIPTVYTSLSSASLTKTAIYQTCLLLSLNPSEPCLIRCDQNATFLVMECALASTTTCHSLWTSNPPVRFLCPRQPWRHVLQTHWSLNGADPFQNPRLVSDEHSSLYGSCSTFTGWWIS